MFVTKMENLELTEFLESYLPTKLPDYKISGHNFMVNCLYCTDTKKKLGIDLNTGAFHCFHGSCEKRGPFVELFALLEGISIQQANIELNLKILLRDNPKPKEYRNLVRSLHCEEELENAIPVYPDSYNSSLECVQLSWTYLMSRKLFDLVNGSNNHFLTIQDGFYKDRVIIPYVHENTIVYFQARALKDGMKPKYLCATQGKHLIRGADVLYPFNLKKDYVVVCEGPIDARSLQLQGVNATCTTGVCMSHIQADSLRMFGGKIIMAYDNDQAGIDGIKKANNLRKKKMMKELFYCYPPEPHKDWNAAHTADIDLNAYIKKESKSYDFDSYMISALNSI